MRSPKGERKIKELKKERKEEERKERKDEERKERKEKKKNKTSLKDLQNILLEEAKRKIADTVPLNSSLKVRPFHLTSCCCFLHIFPVSND